MSRPSRTIRWKRLAWLIAATALVGCAHHQIPAIDPTGERIFSGSTTLAKHDWHGLFHKHRDPVATTPIVTTPVLPAPTVVAPAVPVQPACTQPPVAVVPVTPVCPVQPQVAVPAAPVIPVTPVACAPQQMPPTVLPGRPQVGGQFCATGAGGAAAGPELRVTPARLVAPVGTEVILAAGICDPNGYYVMRQPLEWMLAQDGAGQIVAVGHESPHDVSLLLRNSPQKVATNYARAHTSTIQQVLDRGTPNPADDVFLEKGQSWITITSQTEGTSHVVVWAPKEQNWDRRKAAATIHWVDAAWRFPAPAAVRAGNKHLLQTIVTRASGDPVNGWIVRYEVVGGPPAAFGVRGEQAIEVRTDAAGRAAVELLPGSMEAGITSVRVQVIRPGTARGDLAQMVVGQGTTAVQWTTPGLSVRAIGTSTVAADGAVTYRVEVTNNGDLPSRGVALSYAPPPGVTLLNASPPAHVFGQRYEWRLGDLPPRTTMGIELNCRASVAASVRSAFKATSADGLAVEGSATTEVFKNALSVKMTGPDSVEVGREARFLIDVTNVGDVELTNLVATDTFEPGLSERNGAKSPAVRTLTSSLAPGQTHSFAVTFVVTQPGRHCHRLAISADGGHAATTQGCLTATSPAATPASLSIRVQGPEARRPGETADFTVEIANSGTGPATGVVLNVRASSGLVLDRASPGVEHDAERGVAQWRIPRLVGGETITRQLRFHCEREELAVVRATATCQQSDSVSAEATMQIGAPGGAATGPAPLTVEPSSPQPLSKESRQPSGAPAIDVAIAKTADPIRRGDKTAYIVTISNWQEAAQHDVALKLQTSAGLRIVKISSSPAPALRTSADEVEFTPVRELRPGEQLPPFRVEVEASAVGPQTLSAQVITAGSAAPITAEAKTTVVAP